MFGQVTTDNYRFSKDIIDQIDKDTTSWKYQSGATELSLGGYYKDVLKVWDKDGLMKPKITQQDSLYFYKCNKINARNYILERSESAQILIINEAHHVAKHRTFTRSLLKGLYEKGYRYRGLEALFETGIN